MTVEQLEHADFLRAQQEEEKTIWEIEAEAKRKFLAGESKWDIPIDEVYGPTEEDLVYMEEEVDNLLLWFPQEN